MLAAFSGRRQTGRIMMCKRGVGSALQAPLFKSQEQVKDAIG